MAYKDRNQRFGKNENRSGCDVNKDGDGGGKYLYHESNTSRIVLHVAPFTFPSSFQPRHQSRSTVLTSLYFRILE